MPVLDKLTFKNPIVLWFNRRGRLEMRKPLIGIVQRQFAERKKVWEKKQTSGEDNETLADCFLAAERENKEKIKLTPDRHAVTMVTAGSETT